MSGAWEMPWRARNVRQETDRSLIDLTRGLVAREYAIGGKISVEWKNDVQTLDAAAKELIKRTFAQSHALDTTPLETYVNAMIQAAGLCASGYIASIAPDPALPDKREKADMCLSRIERLLMWKAVDFPWDVQAFEELAPKVQKLLAFMQQRLQGASADDVARELWGDNPPVTYQNSIDNHIHKVNEFLGQQRDRRELHRRKDAVYWESPPA